MSGTISADGLQMPGLVTMHRESSIYCTLEMFLLTYLLTFFTYLFTSLLIGCESVYQ